MANYPFYLGFDVSPTAVAIFLQSLASDERKRFAQMSANSGETAQLALSLDVIYHRNPESGCAIAPTSIDTAERERSEATADHRAALALAGRTSE